MKNNNSIKNSWLRHFVPNLCLFFHFDKEAKLEIHFVTFYVTPFGDFKELAAAMVEDSVASEMKKILELKNA